MKLQIKMGEQIKMLFTPTNEHTSFLHVLLDPDKLNQRGIQGKIEHREVLIRKDEGVSIGDGTHIVTVRFEGEKIKDILIDNKYICDVAGWNP